MVFFGSDQAIERAIAAWGPQARRWARANGKCEIGTGGSGCQHIVIGSADNWLDATRNAGLFEEPDTAMQIFAQKAEAEMPGVKIDLNSYGRVRELRYEASA